MSAGALAAQPIAGVNGPGHDRLHRFAALISILALVTIVLLRIAGPSDLYDQTQPKTVAYTTDMLVNGGTHWVLPIERGELPATKPPLFNWIAAPWVKVLGFHSEIGHKMPSVIAMLVCWLIIVRLGNRIDRETHTLGWLAGLCFMCNYAVFKLGYLARPDMVLAMWLLIAWACATRVFISEANIDAGATVDPAAQAARGPADDRASPDIRTDCRTRTSRGTRRGFAMLFWLAVTLAAMTKGPVALVVVISAIIAARFVAGRFSAIRLLHPIIGSLFAMTVFGAWVWAVWRIDPNHLHEELWFNEVYGRITGTGDEGTRGGTRSLLMELPYQPLYFLSRFGPWSLLTVTAIAALFIAQRQRSTLPPHQRRWLTITGSGSVERNWMVSAAIFVVLTVVIFSLSVGKRADYIAVAIPQAALLAAWALLRVRPQLAFAARWLAPTAAAITIATLAYYDHRQLWAPQRGFGDAIRQFIHESTDAIASQPGRVLNCSAGQTHLQAMLGIADADQRRLVAEMIARGEAFWVVTGRTQNAPHEFDMWLQQRRFAARAEAIVRSAELPRADGWPGQVTLWRVTPE